MFGRVIRDTPLEKALREAYEKDLQREREFRQWLCDNMPPFSDIRTDICYNLLFPCVGSFKLAETPTENDPWEEDEYNHGYYYPSLETESGWETHQLIEMAVGEYLYLDLFAKSIGLDISDYYTLPPRFFQSGNCMYIWVADSLTQSFRELWGRQVTDYCLVDFIQRAMTTNIHLLTSNIKNTIK
jgi:hypothetical protein